MTRLASGARVDVTDKRLDTHTTEIDRMRGDLDSMREHINTAIHLAASIARDDTIRVLAEYEGIREKLRAGKPASWPAEAPMTPTRHWEGP